MNFFKRAMLSMAKKKVKSLIVFVVLFIVANMVLVGLSIQSATQKSTELAREKLGSDVTLKVNNQKFMEERRMEREKNGTSEQGTITRPTLTTKTADILKDNQHVVSYNYISSSFGLAKNFNNIKNNESDETTSNEGQEAPKNMFRMGNSKMTTMPQVSFSGTISTDLLSDFKDGDSKIIDGKGIKKDDLGKNVAIIEKNLANENGLKVGSKIKVASIDENSTLELQVVGIYQANTDEGGNGNRNMDFLNPYNKIYMPYDIVNKLATNEESTAGTITSAVYYMDDAESIESFKKYAKDKGMDLEQYTLDANDALYQQMVGPIENVGSFSKTLVTTVSVAGAVILILIIALSLKDRKYEIGVLLSLGESKFKIISQLLVEVLLVAVIAFSASAFTGRLAAERIGYNLLAKEIKVTESRSEQGNPNFGGGGGPMGGAHMGGGFGRENFMKNKNVDVINEMDVSVNEKDLQKLAAIGLLIVIASAGIPTVSVLRFSPKTILSKRE